MSEGVFYSLQRGFLQSRGTRGTRDTRGTSIEEIQDILWILGRIRLVPCSIRHARSQERKSEKAKKIKRRSFKALPARYGNFAVILVPLWKIHSLPSPRVPRRFSYSLPEFS